MADDFGDFEEAPTTFQPPAPSIPSIPSLSDIIDDETLWEFDNPAASAIVQNDEPCVDYFSPYDDGHYSEDISLPKLYLESLKLWSEICFVEETPALKFQWSKSKLYEGMLASLNMNSAKAASKEPLPMPVMIPMSASPLQLELPEQRFKPNDDEASSQKIMSNPTSTSGQDQSIDSLSVPPVNFDWLSSGLSNPLTGASISDLNGILDFETQADNHNNLISLEEELEKYGLGKFSNPDTQELTFGDNSLDLDGFFPNQLSGKNGSNNFKPITELSADGKALLNALPNYSFMLSKILMFPVNK